MEQLEKKILAVLIENMEFSWPQSPSQPLNIPLLSIKKGEQVFIAGPSGSGKSTLLNLIAGIITPQKGSVCVYGTDLGGLSSSQRDFFRGDEIGFIFQQFNLIPYLSVLENILIPCHFSKIRRDRALQNADTLTEAAEQLLSRLDLSSELWAKKARHLSVGQQQRVAAARALIGNPPLLIADEPTSALDTNRREEFLSLLLEECRKSSSTLLFVSHDESISENFPRYISLEDIKTPQYKGQG